MRAEDLWGRALGRCTYKKMRKAGLWGARCPAMQFHGMLAHPTESSAAEMAPQTCPKLQPGIQALVSLRQPTIGHGQFPGRGLMLRQVISLQLTALPSWGCSQEPSAPALLNYCITNSWGLSVQVLKKGCGWSITIPRHPQHSLSLSFKTFPVWDRAFSVGSHGHMFL